MNTLQINPAKIDSTDTGLDTYNDESRPGAARRGGVRAKRHAQRRRLSRNDVVFRTASGVTLIAAGPADRAVAAQPDPSPQPGRLSRLRPSPPGRRALLRRTTTTGRPPRAGRCRARAPAPRQARTAMAFPWSHSYAGRIDEHVVTSDALAGNPWATPTSARCSCTCRSGYDDDPGRRYVSVYVLQGYSGHVAMWRNRAPFRRPFPEMLDDAIARGECPPWSSPTSTPGRRWAARSSSTRPAPAATTRTLRRGGALGRRPLPHAGRPGAPGCGRQVERRLRRHDHADAAARPVRRPGQPPATPSTSTATSLVPRGGAGAAGPYDGSYDRFLDGFRPAGPMTHPDDDELISTYGVAACFSADDDGTLAAAVRGRHGRLVDDVWDRWLAWDPVRMVPARTPSTAADDLPRRRPGRLLPRPRRQGDAGRPGRGGVDPAQVEFSSSRAPTPASSTAPVGPRRTWRPALAE